jgi:hypothetical protein
MPREVPVFLDSDREDLLDDLMAALNRLAAAGCPVTIKDGKLESRAGIVVPSTRGRWASRQLVPAFAARPWPPLLGEDRDEDGFWPCG